MWGAAKPTKPINPVKEITIEVFEVGYMNAKGDYVDKAKKIFSGSPKQLQEKVAEVVES
mgnify:CR=1 FL=1